MCYWEKKKGGRGDRPGLACSSSTAFSAIAGCVRAHSIDTRMLGGVHHQSLCTTHNNDPHTLYPNATDAGVAVGGDVVRIVSPYDDMDSMGAADTIYGNGGDDTVYGQRGNDIMYVFNVLFLVFACVCVFVWQCASESPHGGSYAWTAPFPLPQAITTTQLTKKCTFLCRFPSVTEMMAMTS